MGQYRTPLRYPGGKQRLAPFILEVIRENSLIGGHYVEPYAGGAGVAIELLIEGYVDRVHLNDSSFPVYAFWKSVVTRTEDLCRRISRASLTVTEWKKQRNILVNPKNHDLLDVGFATLYLNRCNRSGVLSGGLIGGLNQDSKWKMDARFPRNNLIQRIEAIGDRKSDIRIRNLDAEKFIREYVPRLPVNTLVYCDPPYFEKSSRLYLDHYKRDDHKRISIVIQNELRKKWVVSYDGVDEVLGFYSDRRKFLYNLQYNASSVYMGKEVFIFSDDLIIPCSSSVPYVHTALRAQRSRLFAEK